MPPPVSSDALAIEALEMWWGGSEEGQVGSPPPADPQPEEASAATGEPLVVQQELGDLKDQFDQQQALIGHLKSMLKDKDDSLTSREKEVEDLAVRLAKMKPRLERADVKKRTTQQLDRREPQEAAGGTTLPGQGLKLDSKGGGEEERPVEEKRLPSSESSSRAKILLLRKQLDENRQKFERQQKENTEKRSTMEEMKHRIDKLRSEVEQRDSLIQSLQEGSSSMSDETMTQKLLQQILYKDNTLLELTQKTERLEEVIQEQHESLHEKDRVIESRTEAVTLVAKAENEKNLKTLQELEEVRYQMKIMQEEFVRKEEEYLNDKESLTREINEKTKKVKQLEDNGRRLENLRFELSARNAELQEKIVTLQADTKSLRSQAEMDRNTSAEKDTLLQDLKQKLVKAEAHGQKKLKALEKQLRNLKQNGNSGEQILSLQNSIAELEEEKGNLQLKLVDFDDLKIANEKLTLQRNKLEGQIKHQNNDLDSQLSAITSLETEKIKLVEGTNERENRIYDLETELAATKLSLTESGQAKVTLELKLCEVEEQRDTADRAKTELEGQMSESNIICNDQLQAEKASLEETIQSTLKEKDEWHEKCTGQIATVEECQERTKRAMKEMEEKNKECKRLMNILTDKENTITTMSIRIDKHDSVIAGIEEKLSASIKEADEKRTELKEMNAIFMKERETMEDLKSQLAAKCSELILKDAELVNVSESIETLNRAVNERNISVQNLVGEVSSLQDEINAKNRSINDYINRLEELETHSRHQDTKIEELHSLCLQKEQQMGEEYEHATKLRNDLTNLSQKYETTKSSLESELNVLVTMVSDYKNQVEAANAEVKVKEKEITNNQIVISKYEEEICSKNVLFDEIESKNRSLQQRIIDLSLALSEKEKTISNTQSEMEEHTTCIESLNELNTNLEKRLIALQEEKLQLAQIQVTLEEEINVTRSTVHQKEESLLHLNTEMTSKSHELLNEVDSFKQALEAKTVEVVTLDNSVRSLTADLEERALEVEKWQTEASEKSKQLAEVTCALDAALLETQGKDATVNELYTHMAQTQENLAVAQEQGNHAQCQLIELQENYKSKESELIEIQNKFSETRAALTEVREHFEKSQEKLVATQTELQETQSQCQNNSSLICQLEEKLQSRSTNMRTAEEQMNDQLENTKKEFEAVSAELQVQKLNIVDLEKEVQASREYAENLEIGSLKVQEWATELQSELERVKVEQFSIQNELKTAKEELLSKSSQFEKLQSELDQERQSAQSLQAELSHALSLNTQDESERKAVSLSQQQNISRLENELLLASQARKQLEADVQEKINLLQTQTDTNLELNGNVDSLKSTIREKDEEMQILQNTLLEHQQAKVEIENSQKEVMETKGLFEGDGASQTPPSHDIDQEDSGLISLKNELVAAQSQSKLFEMERISLCDEVSTLKQQLQEARQTITQLQTSLASSATPQPEWDEWGEVDLGAPDAQEIAPAPENTDIISLQKSLGDKDKLLRMIQEQLREALQQVNTISEEKRVLEQQRRGDEAAVALQQQRFEQDQNELSLMKRQLEDLNEVQNVYEQIKQRTSDLEEQLAGKQQEIEVLQQQTTDKDSHNVVRDQHSNASDKDPIQEVYESHSTREVSDVWPSEEIGVRDEVQPPTVVQSQAVALHWQHPTGDDAQSLLSITNVESSEQDPASWFNQDHPQALPVAEVSSQETVVEPHPEQTQTHSQPEIDTEELQYKLSWYEEQWSTWTGHYTQLQATHQEALQQIAQLTHRLQELQLSVPSSADSIEKSPSNIVSDKDDVLEKQQQISKLQSKLSETEATYELLREENSKLQVKLVYLEHHEAQVSPASDSGLIASRLAEADAEVDRLRGFETQVYELQSQIQAFQHQCDAMQNKLAEAENERTRLHEIEVLYGELQSCIQESETKREGSKSRVQELELMVQSAESEISRLRNEIEVLSQASEVVQSDREQLQTDAHGLGAEMTKLDCEIQHLQSEVKKYKKDMGKLQNDHEFCKAESQQLKSENEKCKSDVVRLERANEELQGEIVRTTSQCQRLEQESNQLRSELEVMEGEHGRLQCDYSILEGENNRARGEYEALSQANQMTEAEKESLESEVQRISAQNITIVSESKHLRDEIQRLTEVSTSTETEINRQRMEIERFRSLDSQYRELEGKYSELQNQVASFETIPSNKSASASEPYSLLAEVDWSAEGQIEDEHLLQSADAKYQEEIDCLKKKLIDLEKEKNSIYDELQAAKLKTGKMLQKLKLAQNKNEALSKEVQKLKAKAGGFSDLDQALEEEWKAQVSKAETDKEEMKQKLDEVESEKEHLASQIDVLMAAQEKYLELKEDQDHTLQLLKVHNKELGGQVHALEWRVSELEESLEEYKKAGSPTVVQETQEANTLQKSEELGSLSEQISAVQQEVNILKSENSRLEAFNKELEEKVARLSADNESFQSLIHSLEEIKTKAYADINTYKTSYIELDSEHTSFKKEKEKVNEELRELTYTHDTLEAAYNSMFSEYNDVRDVCDSHKHDIGILKGERDRLVDEVESLKKQLGALHEEEEEEIIRALQDECSSLREQNNFVHEENTTLEVQAQDAKEKVVRSSNALEQNIEVQKLLEEELTKKNEELSFHTTTMNGQERQIAYLNAEIAAIKTKLVQHDQAEESSEELIQRQQQQVEQLQEINQQLHLQVKAAETSLTKLAMPEQEGGGDANATLDSNSELEAALASLHLRDLRCQQFSLEITKLLEERDALQLKLSASLRQTQELCRELSLSHQLPASASPTPSLHQKLAELRELNDTLEQKALSNLQVAASSGLGERLSLPGLSLSPSPMFVSHTAPPSPTAARHADYTLTRETQGTSSTLIDWLMGKR
ncbi:hypothetical protein GWK47_010601 [Chionoecetes opilio]|uniref:Golgin subfamily B member 1-like n=1 Tax=Chionoecetes opilio TaxID=41210 RepID=A0A8J4XX03_CHIOP|nr:hypothetical protein GWK47_010601 [Chionoecetes opilio]